MSLALSVSSQGQFLTKLRERRANWSAATLGAKLVVPAELQWWYWLEFGTASRGSAGGGSYSIAPVDSNYLVFQQGGSTIFSKGVNHPGIAPRRSVTKVLPDIQQFTLKAIQKAFELGGADQPDLIQAAMMESVSNAKILIVESIAVNIPGTRPANVQYPKQSGKLLGNTASSVFENEAKVVPSN